MIAIFLHIICYDIWFYFSHIILHNPIMYYNIHRIHHEKPYDQIIWLDTNEGHYIENIFQPIGVFIPCFSYGFFPGHLIVASLIILLRGLMRHDNRCSWLIGNHHLLHHKHPKYNFGEYWIDNMCGTIYPNKEEYIYGKLYT